MRMISPLAIAGMLIAVARSSGVDVLGLAPIRREGILPSPSSFGRITTRFDPRINRHTGRPHDHARERARRARQAAQKA